MELVSVIIPIYNVEKYLKRCLDSIKEQEYSDIEVILVDDGSLDSSGKICDEYAVGDDRFMVIHKNNGGLSDARNVGMKKASGKYIFFLDADDWVSKDCIKKLYQYLKEKELDIVAGGISISYSDGRCEQYTEYGDTVYSCKDALYDMGTKKKICVMSWNKLYKRSLLDDIYFPVGKINEDEFVTYKIILRANRIGFLDSNTYFYYQREKSISNSAKMFLKTDALEAFEERIITYKKNNYFDLIETTEYARLMYIYNAMKCEDLNYRQKKKIYENAFDNKFLKYNYSYLGLKKRLLALYRVLYIKFVYKMLERKN